MLAKEHIKVRPGSDDKTITLFPNPKTPGVQLYFVASSADSAMSAEERNSPVNSLTLPLNSEKKIEELIIVETSIGEKWYNHFLKVTWKQNGRPYVDLDTPWIPSSENPLLANSVVDGRVRLSMVVGKKENILKCWADPDNLPEGYRFVPADLLCKAAVGTLSVSTLRKKVLTGVEQVSETHDAKEAIPPAQAAETKEKAVTTSELAGLIKKDAEDVAALTERYKKLQEEYKALQSEKDRLGNKLSLIEENARVLGGVLYKIWELSTGTIVRTSIIRQELEHYIATDMSQLEKYRNYPAYYVTPGNYRHNSR